MDSVAHPACCNAKHSAQLSTAQKADRRARRYIRFHAFQSEEKRDTRQELKNSRSQELQETDTDGSEQILASNTSLIAWKPIESLFTGRNAAAPFCNS